MDVVKHETVTFEQKELIYEFLWWDVVGMSKYETIWNLYVVSVCCCEALSFGSSETEGFEDSYFIVISDKRWHNGCEGWWRVCFFFVLFFLVGHATWLPHRMFSFRTSLLCFEKFHYLYHETCLYRCQTKNTDGRKKKKHGTMVVCPRQGPGAVEGVLMSDTSGCPSIELPGGNCWKSVWHAG